MMITREEVERLSALSSPSVAEKTARLLVYLAQGYPQPGRNFGAPVWDIDHQAATDEALGVFDDDTGDGSVETRQTQLDWLGVASAANQQELYWLVYDCLIPQGYLGSGRSDGEVVITLAGWQEIERLKQVNAASRFGFVAMSFRDEFTPLYDYGIAPGITAAGYEPRRVDRTEHNNRIDDEIIASIKQSRFLVADFTVNRGGIYFEAGFGLGLGLPVIWLVKEDQLGEVHFDNRQYNFITWKENAWDQFAARLRFRIEATIGRGPLHAAPGSQPGGLPGP